MVYKVRQFRNGQETAVDDPFFQDLQTQLEGEIPFQLQAPEEASAPPPSQGNFPTLGGPATMSRAEIAAQAERLIRGSQEDPDRFNSSQFNDFLTAGGLGDLIPPDQSNPNVRAANVANDFFDERALRENLEGGIEGLNEEIDARLKPLSYTRNGIPQTIDTMLDALLSGDVQSARDLYDGAAGRYEDIDRLRGQVGELESTLLALDQDGLTPNQAYRDWFRETPTIDGVDFPNINPENESTEDLLSLMDQAMNARARAASTDEGRRVRSGFPGAIGHNIDGWQTLLQEGKIVLDEGRIAIDGYERFTEPEDFVDFFSIALRGQLPEDYDSLDEASQLQLVTDMIIEAFPPEIASQYSVGQAEAIFRTTHDRLGVTLNTGAASEALSEWLAIQSYFTG